MDHGQSKKVACEEMKHLVLTMLLLGVMITPHKVEKKHEPTYKSILDFDPDKQELFVICCDRKPNPKSPMQYLPPVTAF